MADLAATINRLGYAVVPRVLPLQAVEQLLEILANGANRSAPHSPSGLRNLLDVIPAVRLFAQSPPMRRLVEPVLGSGAFPVRGILFDKGSHANWKVPWHQDLSIAVRERKDLPGWGPWSVKAGVVHVQPPVSILQRMLTVRIHLDDCGLANGPLKVIPGSHLLGRLDPNGIMQARSTCPAMPCLVERGGALLMRPLLLHASSVAEAPNHRRVIHLEWAAEHLPQGLLWQEPTES